MKDMELDREIISLRITIMDKKNNRNYTDYIMVPNFKISDINEDLLRKLTKSCIDKSKEDGFEEWWEYYKDQILEIIPNNPTSINQKEITWELDLKNDFKPNWFNTYVIPLFVFIAGLSTITYISYLLIKFLIDIWN